jgi:arginyl-tRNA synthetase
VGKYYVEFDKAYKAEIDALVASGRTKEEAEKSAPILLEAQEMLRQWEANDPDVRALWETMNGWVYEGFNATYARAGVDFDRNYYESQTYVLGKADVLEGLEKGVFYEKDGAVWVDNTAEGLDEKVLLRRDGTSVYMTQDIGTAIKRFEEYPGLSKLIYTVGNEQDYHFKVLFIILKKLGFGWADELFHLSYGMVDLPSGKMKSREGTVVDADDLIDEVVSEARRMGEELSKLDDFSEAEKAALYEMIGLAALKYFLLKVDPKKRMLFDPAASIDLQGHTGPFIQYTYARIKSLLRKAEGMVSWAPEHMTTSALLPEERTVIKLLHHLPAVLEEAATKLDPSALANHTYELVKAYNSFYQAVPVLKEEDAIKRNFRLALSAAVATATKKSMWCLGIEVPERM